MYPFDTILVRRTRQSDTSQPILDTFATVAAAGEGGRLDLLDGRRDLLGQLLGAISSDERTEVDVLTSEREG